MKRYGFFIILAIAFLVLGCDPLPPDTIFTVIYHGNGNTSGFPPTDNQEYTVGMDATILGRNTLEKTGSIFLHWNTKADGTGDSYEPGATLKITNTTVFLYAIWVED